MKGENTVVPGSSEGVRGFLVVVYGGGHILDGVSVLLVDQDVSDTIGDLALGDDNPFILVDVADIHDGGACTEGESIVNKRENHR